MRFRSLRAHEAAWALAIGVVVMAFAGFWIAAMIMAVFMLLISVRST